MYKGVNRRGLLNDMGIDVWVLRPKKRLSQMPSSEGLTVAEKSKVIFGGDANTGRQEIIKEHFPVKTGSVETASIRSEESAAKSFEFNYLVSDVCVWLFSADVTPENKRILLDLNISFLLVKDGSQPASAGSAIKAGEFKWPLLDGLGNPTNALSAFIEKQTGGTKRLFVCPETEAKIGSYLGDTLNFITFPDVTEILLKAEVRKSAWEIIKSATK